MKIVTIAALSLASALALLPAQASAGEAATSAHVSYADLNLRSEAGIRTLDRRLAQAVRAVCSDPDAESQLSRRLSVQRCIGAARAGLAVQRERALARRAAPSQLAARGR